MATINKKHIPIAKKKIIRKEDLQNNKAEKENEKTAEKKVEEKPKRAKSLGLNKERRVFMADLVTAEKYTDEEIAKKANEKFSIKTDEEKRELKTPFRAGKVSGIRWHIEQGSFVNVDIKAKKYERIIEHEGKKIPYSQKPKSTPKKKFNPDNDPLNKVAGIDVHKGKNKKAKKTKDSK